jgi:hypothetical protein
MRLESPPEQEHRTSPSRQMSMRVGPLTPESATRKLADSGPRGAAGSNAHALGFPLACVSHSRQSP